MSRFIKLALVNLSGKAVPFQFIANDGNFVVNPLTLTALDEQGVAERYDIVVDFSKFRRGELIRLVNVLKQTDGRKPDKALSIADALKGKPEDPTVGPLMEFRIVDKVESVDVPGYWHKATDVDRSRVPVVLTEQIPLVTPVRERFIEWKRGDGDSRNNPGGVCIPDCPETSADFPWVVRINGQDVHSLNANRISELIPKPGEVEHWTYINGGGGWDHPIHLHFEEGVTIDRGGASIPATERLVRKDVWRLRPSGRVKFQVRFGEYGGAYVNHCHNTVHEDFAMLLRYQLLTDPNNPNVAQWHTQVSPTPMPTPDGCTYMTPEILPEGDPSNPKFLVNGGTSGSGTSGSTGGATGGTGSTGGGTGGSGGRVRKG
jgi:FtsP/CotA-like multicopper oxidase with cupredoxin domain